MKANAIFKKWIAHIKDWGVPTNQSSGTSRERGLGLLVDFRRE